MRTSTLRHFFILLIRLRRSLPLREANALLYCPYLTRSTALHAVLAVLHRLHHRHPRPRRLLLALKTYVRCSFVDRCLLTNVPCTAEEQGDVIAAAPGYVRRRGEQSEEESGAQA